MKITAAQKAFTKATMPEKMNEFKEATDGIAKMKSDPLADYFVHNGFVTSVHENGNGGIERFINSSFAQVIAGAKDGARAVNAVPDIVLGSSSKTEKNNLKRQGVLGIAGMKLSISAEKITKSVLTKIGNVFKKGKNRDNYTLIAQGKVSKSSSNNKSTFAETGAKIVGTVVGATTGAGLTVARTASNIGKGAIVASSALVRGVATFGIRAAVGTLEGVLAVGAKVGEKIQNI